MMKKALGLLFPVLIFFTFYVARAQSSSARAQSSVAPAQPSGSMAAQDTAVAFTGEKTTWHEGFDRYDFLMDEQTFALTPIRATAEEKFGAAASPKGKIRCIVVVPKKPAPGNPWSWRGCYWDHEPQTEVELLKRGFHIAFIMCDPDQHWDVWYAFLTRNHDFSPRPAFVGMSRGGINEFTWATTHPDKVSCIYADNPALRPESMSKLDSLARHDVPLLHVCGSQDFLLEQYTMVVEDIYHRLGGRISVLIKEGPGHHPHSLKDPALVAGWMEQNFQPEGGTPPPFPGLQFNKSYYYSYAESYRYCKPENTYAVCRGPLFTDCYERYDVKGNPPIGITGMTIVLPKKPAAGNPWVFRANRIGRQAEAVDLALLAKGYTIVAAPITEQAGPVRQQWDDLYRMMIGLEYSPKPVMEGEGAGGGEAYYWAIGHPDEVSCIYVLNPVLRSLQATAPLTDSLAALAKAHIPILHVCGSLDPWYADNTVAVEKKYRQLGGHLKVMVKAGAGHFDALPADLAPIVDFIVRSQP
jgi:pimeloyl-ACP methyl ester carboxylesterase